MKVTHKTVTNFELSPVDVLDAILEHINRKYPSFKHNESVVFEVLSELSGATVRVICNDNEY